MITQNTLCTSLETLNTLSATRQQTDKKFFAKRYARSKNTLQTRQCKQEEVQEHKNEIQDTTIKRVGNATGHICFHILAAATRQHHLNGKDILWLVARTVLYVGSELACGRLEHSKFVSKVKIQIGDRLPKSVCDSTCQTRWELTFGIQAPTFLSERGGLLASGVKQQSLPTCPPSRFG